MKGRWRKVSFRIPSREDARLVAHCASTGVNEPTVIRHAIRAYVGGESEESAPAEVRSTAWTSEERVALAELALAKGAETVVQRANTFCARYPTHQPARVRRRMWALLRQRVVTGDDV